MRGLAAVLSKGLPSKYTPNTHSLRCTCCLAHTRFSINCGTDSSCALGELGSRLNFAKEMIFKE